MATGRLLLDILKPTLMAPVAARVTVLREGRRLQLLDVELVQDGAVTARAPALRVRIGDSPATAAPSSEEHTSELPAPMRTSYAVFSLKKTTRTRMNTRQQCS